MGRTLGEREYRNWRGFVIGWAIGMCLAIPLAYLFVVLIPNSPMAVFLLSMGLGAGLGLLGGRLGERWLANR